GCRAESRPPLLLLPRSRLQRRPTRPRMPRPVPTARWVVGLALLRGAVERAAQRAAAAVDSARQWARPRAADQMLGTAAPAAAVGQRAAGGEAALRRPPPARSRRRKATTSALR